MTDNPSSEIPPSGPHGGGGAPKTPSPSSPSSELPKPILRPVSKPDAPQVAPSPPQDGNPNPSGIQKLVKRADLALKKSTQELSSYKAALSKLFSESQPIEKKDRPVPQQPVSVDKSAPPSQPPEPKPKEGGVRRKSRALNTMDLQGCREMVAKLLAGEEARIKERQTGETLAPPKPFQPIDKYKLASPCSSIWEDQTGTAHFNACKHCGLWVYDFTKMDLTEVEKLVFQEEGQTNPTFYRRRDGKFLTRDCPIGVRAKRKKIAGAVAAAVIVVAIGFWYALAPKPAIITQQHRATTGFISSGSKASGAQTLPGQGSALQAPFAFPEAKMPSNIARSGGRSSTVRSR